MSNSRTITASLEGEQIIVDENLCQLREYNFMEDRWCPKDEGVRPLPRARAEQWLFCWNEVDRFAAMGLLTAAAVTD